jgi:hypothetical protein
MHWSLFRLFVIQDDWGSGGFFGSVTKVLVFKPFISGDSRRYLHWDDDALNRIWDVLGLFQKENHGDSDYALEDS